MLWFIFIRFLFTLAVAREYETFMCFLWRNYEIVNARRYVDDIHWLTVLTA